MRRCFAEFSERLEYVVSSWWGFLLFILLSIASYYLWGWDGIDRWVYTSNAIVVLILVNTSRRDTIAIQRKLDCLVPKDKEKMEEQLKTEL